MGKSQLIKRISVDKFNGNISHYLAEVRNNGQVYYITYWGKSEVAMLPKSLFEWLLKELE